MRMLLDLGSRAWLLPDSFKERFVPNYLFRVQGMTCGGCVKAIENVVKKVDPQAQITVHLDEGTVAVTSALQSSLLSQAILGAGFKVSDAQPGKP